MKSSLRHDRDHKNGDEQDHKSFTSHGVEAVLSSDLAGDICVFMGAVMNDAVVVWIQLLSWSSTVRYFEVSML
jgi:hypothetical protein